MLNGRYLYAIKVHITGETFDLCPADICRTADGIDLNRGACALDAPKTGIRVEAYDPPAEVIADVERIMHRAGIELGGVEYMTDDRDGQRYYYDINALSNFVADGPQSSASIPLPSSSTGSKTKPPKPPAASWLPKRPGNALRIRLPVFGGWLRNVEAEQMEATWDYARRSPSAPRRSATTSASSPS